MTGQIGGLGGGERIVGYRDNGDKSQPFAACTFMTAIDPSYAVPIQYQQREPLTPAVQRPSNLSAGRLAYQPQKDAGLRKCRMIYA